MIDQATIKRRDMLLVASAMLAGTTISATPTAAQKQSPANQKSEPHSPPSNSTPDQPYESPSRGRRFS
jgi:hypothetical protein